MIQSPQSFATLVLGLIALSAFGINAFPLIILLHFSSYHCCSLDFIDYNLSKYEKSDLEDLPRFTPNARFLQTFFSSSKEGAELLFLIIIPAVAAVFSYWGIKVFWSLDGN